MRTSMHDGHAPSGFTLIEVLCVIAITSLLSLVAYPSFQGIVQKTRRADAWTAIAQVQLAQERHRSHHVSYGSLADLHHGDTTPSGHYRLRIADTSATGYTLMAEAIGIQAADHRCRWLALTVSGLHITRTSGPTADLANAAALNRQCWGPT